MDRDHGKLSNLVGGICRKMNLQGRLFDEAWCEKRIKRGRLSQQHLNHAKRVYEVAEQYYPGRCDLHIEYPLELGVHYNTYTYTEARPHQHNDYVNAYGSEDSIRENTTRYNNYISDVYPGAYRDTRYNVVTGVCKTPSIYLVIHWPEFTISNSKKQSLQIKDLFLRVSILPDGSIADKVEGTRITFTPAEYSVGYLHSHLPTRALRHAKTTNKLNFNNFCTGSGEILEFLAYYNSDKTEGNLSSYLLMLDSMVKWESIDGGPHCLMENVIIKNCAIPPVTPKQCHSILYYLTRHFWRYEGDEPPIDWIFHQGKYCIVDNDKFEQMFQPQLLQIKSLPDDVKRDEVVMYKDDAGNYYTPSRIEPDAIICDEYLPFKGQSLKLNIEGEINFTGERTPYVNPIIKQYVKQHLEHTANKIEIRNSCAQRLSELSSNRRVSAQG